MPERRHYSFTTFVRAVSLCMVWTFHADLPLLGRAVSWRPCDFDGNASKRQSYVNSL